MCRLVAATRRERIRRLANTRAMVSLERGAAEPETELSSALMSRFPNCRSKPTGDWGKTQPLRKPVLQVFLQPGWYVTMFRPQASPSCRSAASPSSSDGTGNRRKRFCDTADLRHHLRSVAGGHASSRSTATATSNAHCHGSARTSPVMLLAPLASPWRPVVLEVGTEQGRLEVVPSRFVNPCYPLPISSAEPS
jgi:hypothetical protein